MILKDISPLGKNTTLACGGRYKYRRNCKDPYAYAVKTLTKVPGEYLWVYLPITPELKEKFGELKAMCISSPVNLVEVAFADLVIYENLRAWATEFNILEE